MTSAKTNIKRRTLSLAKIIERAMEIADKDGIDALSMRKLAGALGTTAMSLYNHVENKDVLLDLMLDQVICEVQTPDIDKPWDAMMRRRAMSMRQALLTHRWAAPLLMSRIAIGEAILRDTDATTGCLVSSGFSYAQADWARNAVDSHVYGFTLQELNYPVDPAEYKAAAAQYLPMISHDDYPFMHGAAVAIIEGHYDGITQFDFGLDLVLDGLKRWVAQDGSA